MKAIYPILGFVIFFILVKFIYSIITPSKRASKAKAAPAKAKAAPAKPKAAAPKPKEKPAPQPDNDPTYLRVEGHALAPDYRPATNQPQYMECIAHIDALLKEHVPDFMVLCLERTAGNGVNPAGEIAQLPKHPRYVAGTCINVISAEGKLFCINFYPYSITEQSRANFCKRLAKQLGCGCQLYTANLPNTKGVMVERTLGCIIARNIARKNTPETPEEPQVPITEEAVTPIPVNIQTLDCEDIDEED